MLGSGVVSALLLLLFSLEAHRGRRFAPTLRHRLDRLTEHAIGWWQAHRIYLGGGAARIGLHYAVHYGLGLARYLVRSCEQKILSWQRRNRRIVRSVQAARRESHLTAIAEHKQIHALSEDEKKDLKERSLEG